MAGEDELREALLKQVAGMRSECDPASSLSFKIDAFPHIKKERLPRILRLGTSPSDGLPALIRVKVAGKRDDSDGSSIITRNTPYWLSDFGYASLGEMRDDCVSILGQEGTLEEGEVKTYTPEEFLNLLSA